LDIATGKVSTSSNPNHATRGPKDISNIKNEPIKDPGAQCYVLDKEQCTREQWETVMNGTALIKDWIVVDANTSSLFPDLVGNGTGPGNGSKPTSTPKPWSSATASAGTGQYTGAASSAMTSGRVMGFEFGVIGRVILATVVGSLVTFS
jgi:hypothetical protein